MVGANPQRCQTCGVELSADVGMGCCPACVLEVISSDRAEDEYDGVGVTEIRDHGKGKMPKAIGHYRLVRRIGEGGFGTVYAAEQRKPIRRKVAVKIVKAGVACGEVIARFEAERQALALMDHPNVAHVLDAGQTDDGFPYFVMELVQGLPLNQYCKQVRPSLRELLALFVEVCDGVSHAHQRGIIHRDLKPSNILVEGEGAAASPKIIDFGIAKATGSVLTDKTLLTHSGQLLGTLEYMSPEQALSGGYDVDVRSDVYSLGAVLYEMLCGQTPVQRVAPEEFRLDRFLEAVRDSVVTKPSALGKEVPFLTQGTNLARAGDLDQIVLKAIAKERSRRYASAREFADDLEAFLAGRPVKARAPSAGYRIGKYLKRNWKMVATAMLCAGVVAAAITGVGVMRINDSRKLLATQFAGADADDARLFFKDLRQHAPHMESFFSAGDGARAQLGLAIGGHYPWSELVAASWGAPHRELELVLDAAPAEELSALAEAAWEQATDPLASRQARLGAALTALRVLPDDGRWQAQMASFANLLAAQAPYGEGWARGFAPLAEGMVPILVRRVRHCETWEVANLVGVLKALEPGSSSVLLERLRPILQERRWPTHDAAAREFANVALALLFSGEAGRVLPLLELPTGAYDPSLRFIFTHAIASGGVDPLEVVYWVRDTAIADTARAALLRGLADYDERALPAETRGQLSPDIERLAASHPSAAIHAACTYLLERWGRGDSVRPAEVVQPSDGEDYSGVRWFSDDTGHTMAVLSERDIGGEVAIGITPVTGEEMARCTQALLGDFIVPIARRPDCPAVYVNPQAAMRYCNWVSAHNGIDADEFCYRELAGRLVPVPGFRDKSGYRLPTEEEWEIGCRARAATPIPWGGDPEIGRRYGWFLPYGAQRQLAGVLEHAPNDFGLFGMLGNVEQLCHATAGGWVKCGSPLFTAPDLVDVTKRELFLGDQRLAMTLGFRLARTLPEGVEFNRSR